VTPPAAAATAAPAVRPRRTAGPTPGSRTVPGRPRRVSGPARRPVRAQPVAAGVAPRSGNEAGLVLGLIDALGSLPRPRLLDRLLQGRISIALVAFALIGIVTMQLGLLKLNAGVGRALEREALLQRENAALSIENSEMAAGDHVELRAAQLGMQLIAPGALRFLSIQHPYLRDARRGAAALSVPASTLPAGAGAPGGSTSGEETANVPGGEAASGSGSGGEASSETASAAPAASTATSTSETASHAEEASHAVPRSGVESEAAAGATGAASTSTSSGQAGGSGTGEAAPPAASGGGATAPAE
jgi:hypothetical protein